MNKITPCLWFNGNAEEAVNFYITIFKDAKINSISRWGDNGPYPKGTALTISFDLAGQSYQALNGGADFPFTEAISLSIRCEDQAEVDYYWEKLTADGGKEGPCGWLKDRFGLSWQVVPKQLGQLMSDPKKAARVMPVFMKMKKFIIADLEKAANDG